MAGLITALIFLPLVGALFVSVSRQNFARAVALGFTVLSAVLAFLLWRNFDSTTAGLQLAERREWISSIGAEYLVGIDGLSLLLVVLTSLVFPFALLSQRLSRGATNPETVIERVREESRELAHAFPAPGIDA